MSKSIIILTDGIFPYSVGGIQRHSRLLIETIAKIKTDWAIYVIHPHEQNIFKMFPNVIELTTSDIDKDKNYLVEIYKYSKRAYHIIKDLPKNAPIYAQGLCLIYGIKKFKDRVYFNPHGLESFQTLNYRNYLVLTPFRLLTKYIANNSFKVISLGGKLTTILNSIVKDKSKVSVIPNAVLLHDNLIQIKNKEVHSPIKCLFISRFVFNKGINILVETIEELNTAGYTDKFEFTLAGTGPLYKLYSENNKFSNVEYLGFVEDSSLNKLYLDHDIFVFPTLFEGMPTVILEAMSFGLPIISTNVGAISEILNEQNGYLIEAGNKLELKNALLSFLKLPNNIKLDFSITSYNKISNFYNWDKVALQTIQLLSKTQ